MKHIFLKFLVCFLACLMFISACQYQTPQTIDTQPILEPNLIDATPIQDKDSTPAKNELNFDIDISKLDYVLPAYTMLCTPDRKQACSDDGCEDIKPTVFLAYDEVNNMIYRCDTKPCDGYKVNTIQSGLYTYIEPIEPRGFTVKISDDNKYVETASIGLLTLISHGTCRGESNLSEEMEKEEQIAFIKVDKKEAYSRASNNAYYFTGTTSANCDSITVNAVNTEAGIIDNNYRLTTYKRGDTTFKYGVREDFNNLGTGTNVYTFTAHCSNNQQVSDFVSFNYTPSIPKTMYVPVAQPETIYIPIYESSSNVIETKIDGDFEGWDGETIFKMTDGSIWQQASYDYTYHYAYRPDVLIYRKSGAYYMQVEGVDDEIRVIKLK
jgi:hypothetical protein